jgi:hypothetical protein
MIDTILIAVGVVFVALGVGGLTIRLLGRSGSRPPSGDPSQGAV